MNPVKTFRLIFLLLLFVQCNTFCKQKIDIVIVSIEVGDKIEVQIDDGKENYITISENDESDEYLNTEPIISNYCNGTDSVKLKININNLDTVFYVNSENVKRIYIGENMQNKLFVLNTFRNGSSDFVVD